jgi:hypothetical protein
MQEGILGPTIDIKLAMQVRLRYAGTMGVVLRVDTKYLSMASYGNVFP